MIWMMNNHVKKHILGLDLDDFDDRIARKEFNNSMTNFK